MTVTELHNAFKFGLDKLDSLNYANFEPEEIDLLLNDAQERYIKQRYGLTNVKRQSFEETQKRTEDLKELVVNDVITPSAYDSTLNIDSNARFCTLPTDHWFIIQERANITYSDAKGNSQTVNVPVKPVQHNDFNKIMLDPFNKPDKTEIIRLMSDGKVELVANTGITINSYLLRYIKEPQEISLDDDQTSELSEHCHSEIVKQAIDIALEAIESKRQQTFKPILNTEE